MIEIWVIQCKVHVCILDASMGHYPKAEAWRVASGFLTEKDDGTPLRNEDRKAILHSVSGYASKIAKMVSLTTIFKEVPCSPTPIQFDDEGEEADKTAWAEFALRAGLPVKKILIYAVKSSEQLHVMYVEQLSLLKLNA